MNKKFAFGFDPNKKITYTPKPIQKVEFGTKETAFNKPKAPQPKIEIPKATETEKQVKLPSSFSTTTYEKGKSPFSVVLERNKKQQTK